MSGDGMTDADLIALASEMKEAILMMVDAAQINNTPTRTDQRIRMADALNRLSYVAMKLRAIGHDDD